MMIEGLLVSALLGASALAVRLVQGHGVLHALLPNPVRMLICGAEFGSTGYWTLLWGALVIKSKQWLGAATARPLPRRAR